MEPPNMAVECWMKMSAMSELITEPTVGWYWVNYVYYLTLNRYENPEDFFRQSCCQRFIDGLCSNSANPNVNKVGTDYYYYRTRSDAVGRLQGSRSRFWFPMVSLEFFIDKFLQVALWLWTRLNLWQKWVKAAGATADNLTTLMNSGSLNLMEFSGSLQACIGIVVLWTRMVC
jgi:hypothetical protein